MKDLWAAVPGPMEGWSVARAKQWLVEVSMEDIYADGFAEAQVDGEILATLTLEELLVDVLEVDPDDIDDAMRAEHMGLLAQVAEAREALSRSAGHLVHTLLARKDVGGLQAQCLLEATGGGAAWTKQVQLLNARNSLGEPPVTALFFREPDVQWILAASEILQQGGADMGARDKFGSTVLHHAVHRGDMALLVLALKYVAEGEKYCLDMNMQDTKRGEYANGSWVVVEEDKRYLTQEQKDALESDPVEWRNSTVGDCILGHRYG